MGPMNSSSILTESGQLRERFAKYFLCALLAVAACWLVILIISTSALVAAGILWLAIFTLTWRGIVKQNPVERKHFVLVGAIHALFFVELAACTLGDYTVGGVESVRYALILLALLVPALLCLFRIWRIAILTTALCAWFILIFHVPEQVALGLRLWNLQ
jgi:hypothetical protein